MDEGRHFGDGRGGGIKRSAFREFPATRLFLGESVTKSRTVRNSSTDTFYGFSNHSTPPLLTYQSSRRVARTPSVSAGEYSGENKTKNPPPLFVTNNDYYRYYITAELTLKTADYPRRAAFRF